MKTTPAARGSTKRCTSTGDPKHLSQKHCTSIAEAYQGLAVPLHVHERRIRGLDRRLRRARVGHGLREGMPICRDRPGVERNRCLVAMRLQPP